MKKKLIISMLIMLGASHVGAGVDASDLGAIWFIGDSITQSNADGDGASSPRKSLYDLLAANGYTFTYTGHHTANIDGLPTTGSTVADNLYHYHSGSSGHRIGEIGVDDASDKVIAPNLATYWTTGRLAVVKPKIVLIMLGTNNYNGGETERMRKLIQNILDLPGAGDPAIYVASIPPTGRENNNEEFVIPFNAAIPGIVADYQTAGKKVYFVDHYTALNADYSTNMMPDNLHPSAAGNEVMGKCWFTAIAQPVLAEISANKLWGELPLTVEFDASGSIADSEIVSYSWTFGDGETTNGLSASHTYTEEGNYTVTLEVTTVNNDTDTTTVDVKAGYVPVISTIETTTTTSDTAPTVSADDLAQTQYLSSSSTGGNEVATEHAQLFNGLIGDDDSSTAEAGEVTMDSSNTFTVTLDTSVNTSGYDISGIDSVFGWKTDDGGRANQGYTISVTFMDDTTAILAGPAHWEANSSASYWTKVSFTDESGGAMVSGVKAITFAISEDANAGGVVVAREFDVFGMATLISSGPIHVEGVFSTTDANYGSFASATDLVNAGSDTLASGPTYSSNPQFGAAANNDGAVGAASTTSDITFWLSASAGNVYRITYALDTSMNTLGYDVSSLQTIHGWTSNSGNQKNQNYTVEVSTVDDAAFSTLVTVAYLPFSSENVTGSTKVTVTETDTGLLASKVDAIRFTYTVPASGGMQASPAIREIDVFGEPTVEGVDVP